MDRMHLMQVLVAVVDNGGFAAAARKLSSSPPAVTRAVAELEARLGVRLLTRTTRTVRVTEIGARYVEDCRRILAAAEEADEAAAGLHGAPRGRLTVTAPVLFGRLHVTSIVTDYLSLYPETSVNCWFIDRVVQLVEEGIDAAIRIGALPDSSLQAIPVGSVRRVVCAAPGYLAQHGTPTRPEDLHQHTLIFAGGVSPHPEWRFQRDGQLRTFKFAPRLTTTTNDAALVAAQTGFGLTSLLSYQVAEQLQRGELVRVLADFEPEPIPVHVVHREGRHAVRKVRSFLDLAVDRLRANPALH
ncbi:LysR family transcriptional regulator [Chitinimonas sp.]|uniref:LysR family transcriptional regulator n=1 Tax=Chitinimonas sp. TaxID=1934313 RepID=UPI002F935CEC